MEGAIGFQHAHEGERQEHHGDDPAHVEDAPLGEQLVDVFLAGGGGVAVHQDAGDLVEAHALVEHRDERTDEDAGAQRAHHRVLAKAHVNDHDRRDERDPAQLEVALDRVLDGLAHFQAAHAAIGAIVHAHPGVDDERERIGGDGVGEHRPDVAPEVGAGHGRGEVGGVRERRHLVTEEGARHDGASCPVFRHAQRLGNAHDGQADGTHGTPRGAGGQRNHRGQDAGGGQEDARAEHAQTEVQDGGHRAGGDPAGDDHAHAHDDDHRGQRHLHDPVHVVFHVDPFPALERHEQSGDADADDQRDVRRVVLEDEELHHQDGRGQQKWCDLEPERVLAPVPEALQHGGGLLVRRPGRTGTSLSCECLCDAIVSGLA